MPSLRLACDTTGWLMPSAWASPSSRANVGGRSSSDRSAGWWKFPSGPGSQASPAAARPIEDWTCSVRESANCSRTDFSTTPPTSRQFGASSTFHTYSARACPGWRSANSRPSIRASGSNPSTPRS